MKELEKKEDFDRILRSNKIVLVDFFGTWCGPCKSLNPILEKISDEYSQTVEIVKVDVDLFPELATKYEVRSIPNMIFFHNGMIKERHIGLTTKLELETKLSSINQS